MSLIPTFSVTGVKLASLKAADKVFKAKINPALMVQAVRVYLSNQRQASAQSKSRNEVSVTHAKVWRQKGTGRARHGSRNAPIFVGGAKAHGPSGRQNYSLKLSKKQKQASLHSALSQQFKEGNILVVVGLDKVEPKTQKFDRIMTKLKLEKKQLLLLTDKPQINIWRGVNNLSYLRALPAASLNTYAVLRAKNLIFTKESLKCLD